jgi:tetratricopeptide (TPR) repeat protein
VSRKRQKSKHRQKDAVTYEEILSLYRDGEWQKVVNGIRSLNAVDEHQTQLLRRIRAEAHLQLAMQFVRRYNPAAVISEMVQAVRSAPDIPLYQYYLAQGYVLDGKLDAAEEIYLSLLGTPLQDEVLYHLGLLYLATGETQKAYDLLMEYEDDSVMLGQLPLMKALKDGAATTDLCAWLDQRAQQLKQDLNSEKAWLSYLYIKAVCGTLYLELDQIEKAMAEFEMVLAMVGKETISVSTTSEVAVARWSVESISLEALTDLAVESLIAIYDQQGRYEAALRLVTDLKDQERAAQWKYHFVCQQAKECYERDDLDKASALWGELGDDSFAKENLYLVELHKGWELLQQEKYKQVIDVLKALGLRYRRAEVCHYLAIAYEELADPKEAIAWWGRAISAWRNQYRDEPDNSVLRQLIIEAHRHRAQLLMDIGDSSEGFAELEKAALLAPDNRQIGKPLMNWYLENLEFAKARRILRTLIQHHPDDPELVIQFACSLEVQDKDEEALAAIQELIERHPNDTKLQAVLGEFYSIIGKKNLEDGDDQIGLERLLKAAELRPDDPELPLCLYVVYTEEGEEDLAAELLERIDKEHGDRPEILVGIGAIELQRDDLDQASKFFRKACRIADEKEPVVRLRIANAYLEHGEHVSRATYQVNKALEKGWHIPEVWLEAAELWEQNYRFEKAINTLESALEHHPDDIRIHVQLACCARNFWRLGLYFDEIAYLEEWLDNHPNSPMAEVVEDIVRRSSLF